MARLNKSYETSRISETFFVTSVVFGPAMVLPFSVSFASLMPFLFSVLSTTYFFPAYSNSILTMLCSALKGFAIIVSSRLTFFENAFGNVPYSAKEMASITELFPEPIFPAITLVPFPNSRAVLRWVFQFSR